MRMILFSFVYVFLFFSTAGAFSEIPLCMGKGQPLPVNNEQVLNWKYKSKNQFKDRGHISGVLTKVYKDKTGHRHFQVRIGEEPRDTIEVIYNQSFGRIQEKVMQIGAIVEACGDYITSNKRAGGYQASPDGAVLHWVHKSTNPRHDSGYVAIEGELYGYSGKESHDLEAVY